MIWSSHSPSKNNKAMPSPQPLPHFPLFPDPVKEKSFTRSHEPCSICSQATGWLYDGPIYGDRRDEPLVCPWCIANGRAAESGCSFNDATIYPYSDTTPQMSPADAELVEKRTPGYTTWQGNRWLMCCGRACIYLGEAENTDELRGRFAQAIPSLFAEDDLDSTEQEEVINQVVRGAGPCCAYIFSGQVCEALTAYWDCH